MKILALDSSGLVASVALLDGESLLAEYTVNYKKTHSQTLLPMLDEIVKMTQTDLSDVDVIAVAAGPGSFTGLRIGSATAKGLGLALNKPLISVPTLEGLAYNYEGSPYYICPMMDARRSQVYTGIYHFIYEDGQCKLEELFQGCACAVSDVLEECNKLDGRLVFLGDGVPVYLEQIRGQVKVPYMIAPPHLSRQRAGAVAERARVLYVSGRSESAAEHAPQYFRKSQAERELEKKRTEESNIC